MLVLFVMNKKTTDSNLSENKQKYGRLGNYTEFSHMMDMGNPTNNNHVKIIKLLWATILSIVDN